MRKKTKIQTILFSKKVFHTRKQVKNWILSNGFKFLKYKKQPIENYKNYWRVRQRHPKYFKKSTFRTSACVRTIKSRATNLDKKKKYIKLSFKGVKVIIGEMK